MAKVPAKKLAKTAKSKSPNSAMKKGGPKQVQKGIVQVIKANKFKPVASPAKKSTYKKLETVLRSKKASAAKTGNARIEARAEGNLRGLSVLRQDAAAARRGSRPVAGSPAKKKTPTYPDNFKPQPLKSSNSKVMKTSVKSRNPLTSIGAYMGMDWTGTKKVAAKKVRTGGMTLNRKKK
jgi:hypothetical protein